MILVVVGQGVVGVTGISNVSIDNLSLVWGQGKHQGAQANKIVVFISSIVIGLILTFAIT